MKKSYNVNNDVHQKEGQEQAKKLYRYIRDHVKNLDDARSCARNVSDLFKPSVQVQRSKFKDYCERLIFTNPLLTGRKGEELLWRKGFYEVVVAAKQLKKGEFTVEEKASLENHINAGIGHYHHYILRLRKEFDLELNGIVDFIGNNDSYLKKNESVEKELLEWANLSVHRSLVYLGDLSRYKLDLYPNWDQNLVIRYYSQALLFKPEYGMPHNQMGTLANNSNNVLEACYYYLRSLCCRNVFEGTENNLVRLFEKNATILNRFPIENQESDVIVQLEPGEHIKRFISRFLNLIEIWWFEKKVNNNRIYDLCHQTNVDLQECMNYLKPLTTESVDTNDTIDSDSLNSTNFNLTNHLNHNVVFKIVSICLLCVHKLQSSNSQFTSSAVAFSLAVYSQLVSTVINHVQEGILNFPLLPTEENQFLNQNDLKKWLNKNKNAKKKVKKKKKLVKRRRRKLIQSDSDDDDDNDDDNDDIDENDRENNDNEDESSDDNEIIDDDDDESLNSNQSDREINDSDDESFEEELENNLKDEIKKNKEKLKINIDDKSDKSSNEDGTKNSPEDIVKKSKLLELNDLLSIIGDEPLLQSIKIFNDWLKFDVEILKSCGKLTRSLLHQIVNLINLISIDFNVINNNHNVNNNNNNNNNSNSNNKELNYTFLKENEKKLALPEDVLLKGIEILNENQREIDWKLNRKVELTVKQQNVLRIIKMVGFGNFLTTIHETGVVYDKEIKLFVAKFDENRTFSNGIDEIVQRDIDVEDFDSIKRSLGESNKIDTKNQLLKMKHMGQLWLTAEVKDLETRVKGKPSLSPYLVIDADSLILHTQMVKQLVYSRKFIVLVPSAVVSALDDLKSEKLEARDAIRWLESQFHQGNRFFRCQRPQEHAPIPYIVYPKKRDKESQMFIQIIECCHYLAQQQKGASNLVTLLVGNTSFNAGETINNKVENRLSYVGLAKTAGVNLEGIVEFYGRWKKTVKGKR